MNMRHLKPSQIKALVQESEDAYNEWLRSTNGVQFGTNKPLDPIDIFRWAFSKGASSILRRVDAIKD